MPWRRAAVTLLGSVVLLVGVAMIVLPGPATLVIPAGLAILAREYHWARRLMARLRAAWPGWREGYGGGRRRPAEMGGRKE